MGLGIKPKAFQLKTELEKYIYITHQGLLGLKALSSPSLPPLTAPAIENEPERNSLNKS